MMSLFIRLTLAVLVINHLLLPCEALRGYGSRGQDKGYKDPGKPKTFAGTSSGLPSQNATRRGLGISAWGIVTIIITLILAGMGFYYFSICYPMLCKKSHSMIGAVPVSIDLQ